MMDSDLRCGSATRLEFFGYDSVTRTAEALIPRAPTCGTLSKGEMNGCAIGSPAARALVSLGALLVNLEAAPDEVPANGAHRQGMDRRHRIGPPTLAIASSSCKCSTYEPSRSSTRRETNSFLRPFQR